MVKKTIYSTWLYSWIFRCNRRWNRWGPIATPILLTSSKMEPRKVIGSADTSEFAIAVSSTLGFLLTLGWTNINLQWVLALMLGGVIRSSYRAWLVKIIPTNLLGTLVGGIIIITNIRTLLAAFDISQIVSIYTFIILGFLWMTSVLSVIWKIKNYNKQ